VRSQLATPLLCPYATSTVFDNRTQGTELRKVDGPGCSMLITVSFLFRNIQIKADWFSYELRGLAIARSKSNVRVGLWRAN